MLAGSLYLLWPWRVATEMILNDHAFTRYEHVMPEAYAQSTGLMFSPFISLGLLVAGLILVLLLEVLAGNLKLGHKESP
jgi:hypothetical protein